jgi:hypothetical protein
VVAQLAAATMTMGNAVRENWPGFLPLAFTLLGSAYYITASGSRGTIPAWTPTMYWPWVIYSKLLMLYIIYSIMQKYRALEEKN